MTDIERLELEIAERKAEIKRIKEERYPSLKYDCIRDPIENKYGRMFGGIDKVTHHLRCMVLQISSMHKYKNMHGMLVTCARREIKISEVSTEKIRICNNLLLEIAPILVKYMFYFIDTNDMEE